MDPNNMNLNNKPTATPTTSAMPQIPVAQTPVTPVVPTVSAMPEMPTPVNPVVNPAAVPTTSAMPEMPTAPAAPVAPVESTNPVAPEVPAEPVMSAEPEPIKEPVLETPVTPVTPVAPEAPVVSATSAAPAMPEIPTPVSPIFQPGDTMVSATDPITMPNPPKEPDPIEEELNAPMKAAGPVPGSIGSAISMPSEQEQTAQAPNQMGQVPSVAFNDPATMQQTQAPAKKPSAISSLLKNKMNKKTLIMLCVLAGLIVVALAVVLIMQMAG